MGRMGRKLGMCAIIFACAMLLGACRSDVSDDEREGYMDRINEADRDLAIRLAEESYELAKSEGVDFSKGPCLDNDLMEGWVADVAHNPREEVDNLPENQCPAYSDTAGHFVELDPDGNLIRAE